MVRSININSEKILGIRANINEWISKNFPNQRVHISHSLLSFDKKNSTYHVAMHIKQNGNVITLGKLNVIDEKISLISGSIASISNTIDQTIEEYNDRKLNIDPLCGDLYEFRFGDGIEEAAKLDFHSVHLLLTDPPYNISKSYICEKQVPRRLRKNGSDFIMPKGHFGKWDESFPEPKKWTEIVLPKVKGWAVVFCAQAQIKEYCEILTEHKFVAVGPMVWHKTNPVPFNHKFKPLNAWEAIVVGKRPGTKFNGHAVHNVFSHKSPSPQQRIHPTQKPLPLLKEFVKLFSQENDLVLDPFAGSATTVLACIEQKRRVLAYENDPELFYKAANRIYERNGIFK